MEQGKWYPLCTVLFVVERTKFDFSRPRKVEPPAESSIFPGLEMELRARNARLAWLRDRRDLRKIFLHCEKSSVLGPTPLYMGEEGLLGSVAQPETVAVQWLLGGGCVKQVLLPKVPPTPLRSSPFLGLAPGGGVDPQGQKAAM